MAPEDRFAHEAHWGVIYVRLLLVVLAIVAGLLGWMTAARSQQTDGHAMGSGA